MKKTQPVDARTAILSAIKNGKPTREPLPEIPQFKFTGDITESFKSGLVGFDGKVTEFNSREEAIEFLEKNLDKSQKIYSSANGVTGNIADENITSPQEANIIDICVTEGIFGVAETGSIWVTNKSLRMAATALLSTDLYILLDKKTIKGNSHDAYRETDIRANQYGSFYTGPSATADIEGVHITGAQAEISLTVLLY